MRLRLANITAESLTSQSAAVTRHVLSHPAFQKSNAVACYLSMPKGEIQTDEIVNAVLAEGKTLYVPRLKTLAESSVMEFLRIHSKEDLESNLVPGVWGIREPSVEYDSTPRESASSPSSPPIDLILMPGMAFDRTLSRLGHGKGYYDRFISTYRSSLPETSEKHEVFLCGLGLDEQVLEDGTIPMTETDVRLNSLITSQGVQV